MPTQHDCKDFENWFPPASGPRVRQRVSGSGGGGFIPLMPSLIPAELYQWIEDRQTDLQEALVNGNSARVLELTSKMAEGAEQLREITCSRMVS